MQIKKNIVLFFMSLLCIPYIFADIDPQPGENLHYLVQRIALEIDKDFDGTFTSLDVITNKVCDIVMDADGTFTELTAIKEKVCDIEVTTTLILDAVSNINMDANGTFTELAVIKEKVCDILATTTSCCTCDVFITQADIPYTISQPGTYCLAESVSLNSAGTAILIASSDVILDLQGHIINADGSTFCIDATAGYSNITIRNGYIVGPTAASGGFGNGYVQLHNVADVLIHDIKFEASRVDFQTTSTIRMYDCVFVKQQQNDPCIYLFQCTDPTLSRIEMFGENGNQAISVDSSDETIIEDCTVRDEFSYGIEILSSADCVVRNCKVFETDGISGFLISNSDNLVMTSCVANRIGDAASGFEISGDYIFIKDCIANNNTLHGFGFDGNNSTIKGCIAQGNTSNGFICTGTGNQFISCSAIDNSSTGFVDGTGSGANRFFNNVAYDNTTADYSGVTIAPTLSSGAIDNTTGYWINIST